MALSIEEKDALAEHYKGKDIYDPSKAPEQATSDFAPRCMCGGGHVMGMCGGGMAKGYSDGGDVNAEFDPNLFNQSLSNSNQPVAQASSDAAPARPAPPVPREAGLVNMFDAPSLSGDTDTVKGRALSAFDEVPTAGEAPQVPLSAPGLAKAAPDAAAQAPAPQSALNPKNAPVAPAASTASADTLAPNQYDELVKALSARPGIGQAAMSGLAGLADAISTGVGRSSNPGFQKNIMETQQNQKQNLINALRAKYETKFRGQELGQSQQRINDENTRAANAITAENLRAANTVKAEKDRIEAELGVRAKEAELGRRQSGMEAAAKLPATGILHPSTWGKGSEIESVRDQLLSGISGNKAANPLYQTPQAQAIKQQYQQGKITKDQANKMLGSLGK